MTAWQERIELADLWDAFDDVPFPELRDKIVDRLRESSFARYHDAVVAIANLELQDDLEGFNYEWNLILDLADQHKIWLETIIPAPAICP